MVHSDIAITNILYFISFTILPNEHLEFIKIFPQNYTLLNRFILFFSESIGILAVIFTGKILGIILKYIKPGKENINYKCIIFLLPLCFYDLTYIYVTLFIAIIPIQNSIYYYLPMFIFRLIYNLFIL